MATTIRQEINILTTGLTVANSTITSSEIIQLDTTQYVNPTYYFEAVANNGSGTGTNKVSLRRKGTTTDDALINSGITSATQTRYRSTSFTPPAGQTEYVVFWDTTAHSSSTVKTAKLIIIDSPTTLTSSETQIEIGMNKTGLTSTTATEVVPDTTLTKYWKYTAANWDGTKTFYAEVTYLMASSKSSGTFVLQEDNGSFASWTDKVTIVNAGVASAATRTRSAAFTPTDGRNYRIAYLVASSKSAASIFNAKIIVDQTTGIALVQKSSSNTPATPATLPVASTAGTLLVAFVDNHAATSTSVAGWSAPTGQASTDYAHIMYYPNNPGGITSVNFGKNAILAEFSGASASPFDTFGTASGATSPQTATTSGNVSNSNSLAVFAGVDNTGAGVTNSGPSGYTTITNNSADLLAHVLASFKVNPTSGTTASGTYTTSSGTRVGAAIAIFNSITLTSLTLLEPQYLLLNTNDSNVTGVQSYPTLWDSTEWANVTNVYKHAMDSDNASNSAKLRDLTAGADITSTVTGANQQISSAITMPTTGHEIDTWILNTTGVVGADRIIVATTVVTTDDSVSVSDTEAITESVTARIELFVNKSDSVSLSESNSQTLVSNTSVSDTEAITDSVLRRLDSNPSVSDTEAITEAQTLLIPILFAAVSDSIAATDSVAMSAVEFVSKSDTASVTDTVQLSVTDNLSVNDAEAITDSVTVRADENPRVSDSVTVTESTSLLIPTLFITTSDSVGLTEAVLLTEPESIGISDNLSITEATSLLIPTLFISTSDTEAITESVTMMEQSFISKSDTEAITDAVILSPTSFIATSDSEAITDSTAASLTSFVSVNDAEVVTDAVTAPSVSYQISKSDTAAITDSVSLSIAAAGTLSISVSDSLAVTDSVTVSLTSFISTSDTDAATDSVTVRSDTNPSVSDTEAITDLVLRMAQNFISVSDSLSLSENVAVIIPIAGAVSVSVSDSEVITDAVSVQTNLSLSVSDSIAITDSVNRLVTSSIAVSNSLTITDSNNQLIPTLLVSVNDTLATSEAINLLTIDRIAVSDSLSLSENTSVAVTSPIPDLVSVSDSLTISESTSLVIPTLFVAVSNSLSLSDDIDIRLGNLTVPYRLLPRSHPHLGPKSNNFHRAVRGPRPIRPPRSY